MCYVHPWKQYSAAAEKNWFGGANSYRGVQAKPPYEMIRLGDSGYLEPALGEGFRGSHETLRAFVLLRRLSCPRLL